MEGICRQMSVFAQVCTGCASADPAQDVEGSEVRIRECRGRVTRSARSFSQEDVLTSGVTAVLPLLRCAA